MQQSIKQKRLFLLDMDGTLYLGNQVFEGTHSFLQKVTQLGGRYLFLTNNSSKNAAAYVQKLAGMGIHADEDDFITSVHALIYTLSKIHKNSKIYALGTESFQQQLRSAGFDIVNELCDGINCLVMGFDTELSFKKLEDASKLLTDSGVDYIATNPDWVCPTEFGAVPDCGSIAQALQHATGRLPRFVGKPESLMVRLALEKTGIPLNQTVLIGDRLYTDIACGLNAGVDTALVFSGETTPEDLCSSEIKPTYFFQNISEIDSML